MSCRIWATMSGHEPEQPSFGVSTTIALERPANGVPWGPLLLIEQIGRGAFGEVFRAWDPALAHEVALKRLRLPADAMALESAVVREGQLLARVKHPNVVTVHGACRVGDEVGIWMDFLHGRTLEQVVRSEGPMSAQEATVIGDSLCRALAAVHAAGLIHRDVKASNVMREAGGRIVLVDFGVGVEGDARSAAGVIAGTPLYLAPEVLDGAAASPLSDIYSLGVLLFYLTTGSYPVTGQSLAEIQSAHHAGRRRLLSDIRADLPGAFARAVERAISPRPEDRHQSAGAMMRDLTDSATATVDTRFDWKLAVVPVLCGTVGVWILGLLTSVAFNVALERTAGFADDTFLSYWIWGFRALLAPAVFMIVATLLALLLAPLGRRAVKRVLNGPVAAERRLWVWLLVVSQVLLVAYIGWRFQGVFNASTSRIALAAPDVFADFRPERSPERTLLNILLSVSILGSGWAWLVLLRGAGSIANVGRGAFGAGMASVAIMLALLVVPYRLSWHNRFERVMFDSARCYVIGTARTDSLLYCPTAAAPRTRVVASHDPLIERTHIVESIFAP